MTRGTSMNYAERCELTVISDPRILRINEHEKYEYEHSWC